MKYREIIKYNKENQSIYNWERNFKQLHGNKCHSINYAH